MAQPLRCTVPERLVKHVLRGHPWIFAGALERPDPAPETGAIVDLVDGRGRAIGEALYDADSPIALRVLGTRHAPPAGPELWRARVREAWALRERVIDRTTTTAFRALHGEGDRLPGVVADFYAGYLVLKLDTPAWLPHLPALVAAFEGEIAPRGIYLKGLVGRAGSDGPAAARVLAGDPPPDEIEVAENGVRVLVNVRRGQKTGMFLDQRDNRALVRSLARGMEVLNLYAYTGGFSVAAALGGARRVTSVDLARDALADARRNFAANGLDPGGHEFIAADALAYLKLCAQERRQFDMVIVDPPSFAMRSSAVEKAARAYRSLNERALRQVRPGGLLATASCSSHVTPEAFLGIVREAAGAVGKPLRTLAIRGEPPDHPTPIHFPEGRYLKFVLGTVD
jgi:23S rRNA (cytosine1962-C5)-methyltransferase